MQGREEMNGESKGRLIKIDKNMVPVYLDSKARHIHGPHLLVIISQGAFLLCSSLGASGRFTTNLGFPLHPNHPLREAGKDNFRVFSNPTVPSHAQDH